VLGRAIARVLPAVPRPVVRRLSARYIAGSELAHAVRVVTGIYAEPTSVSCQELADALVREGRRVRVYVPYGRQWYEYSLRRLQENPLVAGYVASDLLRRVVPGSGRRA